MARYISDQNKVVLIHESGTYSAVSGAGQWIGQVTENSISDAENKLENRYLGTATRSYDLMEQGPRDVTGTLTYHAQDMRLPFWAIGSVVDGGTGSKCTHIVSQINTNVWQSAFTSGTGKLNAPISFTIEDSKQSPSTGRNFLRTVNGVVPNAVTITATQGEKVQVAVDYIGQTVTASSGTTTSVTEESVKPYLWSSTSLTLGGSTMSTIKELSFEINNNVEAPHYLNGSRDISVPYPQNRDYTLNLTMDLDGTDADRLYNSFYKSNTAFNGTLDFNQDVTAVGSQHSVFVLSGCKITSMEIPSAIEGATETTIEIRPQNVTGSSWDRTAKYNPW